MTDAPQTRPGQPARRRAKRLALIAGATLLIAGVLLYRHYTSDAYLRPHCIEAMEELTGGKVRIERIVFSPAGHIDVYGLALEARGLEEAEARLMQVPRLTLHFSRSALLRGRFEPIAVMLRHPTMYLTEDQATGQFNVEHLAPAKQPLDTRHRLPKIFVDQGEFVVAEVDRGAVTEKGRIDLSGQMFGDPDDPGRYRFTLHQLHPVQAGIRPPAEAAAVSRDQRIVLDGWFDLQRAAGQLQMYGLSFSPAWRDLLPRRARLAWEQFQPSGSLPQVTVHIDPEQGRRTEVDLKNVALTLPQLTEEDYRFQLYDVDGRFVFTDEAIEVRDLVGKVREQDVQYTINGRILGYSEDAPFELGLATNAFTVPREPVHIFALPFGVQHILQKLDARGQMRVSMKVKRETDRGKVDYDGTATIVDGNGRYDRFPYFLTNCRGLLRFDREKIEVKQFTGDAADGGTVTVSGVISPPSEDAAVDVVVTAVNMPLDQTLYDAFPERHQPALDLFFHRPTEQRLLQQGNFISHERHDQAVEQIEQLNDELLLLDEDDDAQRLALNLMLAELQAVRAKPAFGLGGRADMVIQVTTEQGKSDDYQVTADVKFQQAEILFQHFGYPMIVTGGGLHIEPGRVLFKDVKVKGLYGGVGGLDGVIALPQPDKPLSLDVKLHALGLPVDEPFYDAIPQPQDRWVRDLKVKGAINVIGRVFTDPKSNDVAMNMLIDLENTRAAPGTGDLALEDIHGRLTLTMDRVQFEDIRGRFGPGTLKLAGFADWSDEGDVHMALQADAEGLRFEDRLHNLTRAYMPVDPRVEKLWNEIQPRGVFDGTMRYESKKGKADYDLAVRPESLTLTFDDKPLTIEKLGGTLHVRPDHLQLEKLSGQFDDTAFQASGQWAYNPAVQWDLALSMQSKEISPVVRKLAPEPLIELLDALDFKGGYHIDLDRLQWRPNAEKGLRLLASGDIKLTDANLTIGAPIENLNGDMKLHMQRRVEDKWSQIQLVVHAKQLDIFDRNITDLQAKMTSESDSDLLLVPVLRGRCCDGAIGGTGRLGLKDRSYQFQLALSNADLVKLMDQPKASSDQAEPENETKISKGRVSASLDMRGQWDKPASRRGRGDIQVGQAVLYDLPLAMGLLQVANLSLPTSRAFNKAQLSYFVKDNQVTFERITLRSPSLLLSGKGNLQYDSRKIDLTLTSNNPKAWNLGPVSDIIDTVRDQLITIRVTGTVDKPDAEVKQFHAITKAWRDVFGEPEKEDDS